MASIIIISVNILIFIISLGGAGGKGVWGKLGEESDLDAAIDMKDPNYDSDMLDDDNIVLREITPESSDDELKVIKLFMTFIANIFLNEYFEKLLY